MPPSFVVYRSSFLVLLLVACSGEPTPRLLGPLREVTVISNQWEQIEGTVRSILQEPIPTPQPEPEFKIRVGSPDKFETYSKFRLVFLIGTHQDTLLREVLGARVDSLGPGGFQLLRVPNPWSRGQFALIFLSRDGSELGSGLSLYATRIRQTLRDIVLEQMARAVYVEGVDKGRTDSLSRRYAFTVDVPRRWRVNEDNAESNFVYLYGHVPDRNVFVHWQDTTLPLVPDSLAALRNRLTLRFYDGDSIDRRFLQAETVAFLNTVCLRLSGVWKNDREMLGGPFVNYAFNFRGRFYMTDGLVFNPGKLKLDALTQAEVVLRTFTPQ